MNKQINEIALKVNVKLNKSLIIIFVRKQEFTLKPHYKKTRLLKLKFSVSKRQNLVSNI